MKKINFLLLVFSLMFASCDSNVVTVRGELLGFKGTAKMSAEMPGQGKVVLAEQNVEDGQIHLNTEALVLPARVWFTFNNGKTEFTKEFILDAKDKCSIRGKGKFLDQMVITGSALNKEYLELTSQLNEKFDGPINKATRTIERIQAKDKPSQTDRVLLEYNLSTLSRHVSARFRYAKRLIEANPDMEISMFVLKDMLKDSLEVSKAVFNKLNIENKASNIYQVLDGQFNKK